MPSRTVPLYHLFVVVLLLVFMPSYGSVTTTDASCHTGQLMELLWDSIKTGDTHVLQIASRSTSAAFGTIMGKELHTMMNRPPSFCKEGNEMDVCSPIAKYLARCHQDTLVAAFKSFQQRPASKGTQKPPYFRGLIPPFLGSITPASSITYSTECFANETITSVWTGPSTLEISIYTNNIKQPPKCQDQLQFWLPGMPFKFMGPETETVQRFQWDVSHLSQAEQWYLQANGIRVFHMPQLTTDVILNFLSTGVMMAGVLEQPLRNLTIAANVEFMDEYVQVSPRLQPKLTPRFGGNSVAKKLDPNYINSGDTLIVLRLDGLDPALSWAEGSVGVHSAVALRNPGTPSELYVCESNVQTAYWPVNGIQCTEWAAWLKQAETADLNVLLSPLDASLSAAFNATAAWNLVSDLVGLDYGYSTMLFAWWDVPKLNYPCLPPSFSEDCETTPLEELKAILLDESAGNSAKNMYRQALNHRLQWLQQHHRGNRTPKQQQEAPIINVMYFAATEHNTTFESLVSIPEQDSWFYNTTKNGKEVVMGRSMVCTVFTCNVLKAGGVFDSIEGADSVQCGEQTTWDLNSMAIYDTAKMGGKRPAVCLDADPENELCQLLGAHKLHALPDYNTRSLYQNMGNKCPSKGPQYLRPNGC